MFSILNKSNLSLSLIGHTQPFLLTRRGGKAHYNPCKSAKVHKLTQADTVTQRAQKNNKIQMSSVGFQENEQLTLKKITIIWNILHSWNK
uniref:Uncharacterized protein n=1 Tax=Anguilla anguilla TaxID=7936 RepID=A0A0E9XK56_ANGAN